MLSNCHFYCVRIESPSWSIGFSTMRTDQSEHCILFWFSVLDLRKVTDTAAHFVRIRFCKYFTAQIKSERTVLYRPNAEKIEFVRNRKLGRNAFCSKSPIRVKNLGHFFMFKEITKKRKRYYSHSLSLHIQWRPKKISVNSCFSFHSKGGFAFPLGYFYSDKIWKHARCFLVLMEEFWKHFEARLVCYRGLRCSRKQQAGKNTWKKNMT